MAKGNSALVGALKFLVFLACIILIPYFLAPILGMGSSIQDQFSLCMIAWVVALILQWVIGKAFERSVQPQYGYQQTQVSQPSGSYNRPYNENSRPYNENSRPYNQYNNRLYNKYNQQYNENNRGLGYNRPRFSQQPVSTGLGQIHEPRVMQPNSTIIKETSISNSASFLRKHECRFCGGPVNLKTRKCEYCGSRN